MGSVSTHHAMAFPHHCNPSPCLCLQAPSALPACCLPAPHHPASSMAAAPTPPHTPRMWTGSIPITTPQVGDGGRDGSCLPHALPLPPHSLHAMHLCIISSHTTASPLSLPLTKTHVTGELDLKGQGGLCMDGIGQVLLLLPSFHAYLPTYLPFFFPPLPLPPYSVISSSPSIIFPFSSPIPIPLSYSSYSSSAWVPLPTNHTHTITNPSPSASDSASHICTSAPAALPAPAHTSASIHSPHISVCRSDGTGDGMMPFARRAFSSPAFSCPLHFLLPLHLLSFPLPPATPCPLPFALPPFPFAFGTCLFGMEWDGSGTGSPLSLSVSLPLSLFLLPRIPSQKPSITSFPSIQPSLPNLPWIPSETCLPFCNLLYDILNRHLYLLPPCTPLPLSIILKLNNFPPTYATFSSLSFLSLSYPSLWSIHLGERIREDQGSPSLFIFQ